jgi:hypothetical protein
MTQVTPILGPIIESSAARHISVCHTQYISTLIVLRKIKRLHPFRPEDHRRG